MGGVCLLSLVESARLSLKVTTSNECESLQQTLSSSLLLLFVEGFFFLFLFFLFPPLQQRQGTHMWASTAPSWILVEVLVFTQLLDQRRVFLFLVLVFSVFNINLK